jgi:hypothetical protein
MFTVDTDVGEIEHRIEPDGSQIRRTHLKGYADLSV